MITTVKRAVLPLLAIGSLSIFAVLPAQAAVTLLVDDHIKVTAINGQEVKQGMFQPLIKQFTLEPGQHVITAKYDRLFDLRQDDHDYLHSSNVSVRADLTDNQTYRLTMPGQPDRYREAKKYAQKPTLAIEQGNQTISSQVANSSRSGGLFSGIGNAIGGVFGGGNDTQMANQQAIATINQPSQTAPAVSNNANTLDKFMQLWLQATPDEREKIRQWVAQ